MHLHTTQKTIELPEAKGIAEKIECEKGKGLLVYVWQLQVALGGSTVHSVYFGHCYCSFELSEHCANGFVASFVWQVHTELQQLADAVKPL